MDTGRPQHRAAERALVEGDDEHHQRGGQGNRGDPASAGGGVPEAGGEQRQPHNEQHDQQRPAEVRPGNTAQSQPERGSVDDALQVVGQDVVGPGWFDCGFLVQRQDRHLHRRADGVRGEDRQVAPVAGGDQPQQGHRRKNQTPGVLTPPAGSEGRLRRQPTRSVGATAGPRSSRRA